eukprot:COSAG05_NODE_14_length_36349_cov_27.641655_12_plen_86_part_00
MLAYRAPARSVAWRWSASHVFGAGECLNLGDGGVKPGGGHYIGVVDKSLGHPGRGGYVCYSIPPSLYVLYRGVACCLGCGWLRVK